METKYLIIGNSAGGIGAAEAIREVDKSGSLMLISDEPYPAYSRPMISKYLSGEATLEKMLFRPVDFYQQNNITALLGSKVRKLRTKSRSVELENSEKIRWEKLLLAVGGNPIIPPIEGINNSGVFTFTTLDDAKKLSQFLVKGQTAVVIGGGLIGVSVAEALVKRGTQVTIIEMKDRILNTILDEVASQIAEEKLRQSGVRVMTGRTAEKISGAGTVSGVVLNGGEQISCNLTVLAIGVTPRVDLASSAGIAVNRGIEVDRHMATSHPDVYACGDAAEAYDFVYGTGRATAIWPNAYVGGRVAGYNMAGVTAEYAGGTTVSTLNYFGMAVVAAGMVVPDSNNCEVFSRQKDGVYQKVIIKDDLVKGMVCVGDIEKSGITYSLMRDRVNVGSFKKLLLADDFGLAVLPRELWQELLEKSPAGKVTQPAVPSGVEDMGAD